jgi:hypothetical protein
MSRDRARPWRGTTTTHYDEIFVMASMTDVRSIISVISTLPSDLNASCSIVLSFRLASDHDVAILVNRPTSGQ